MPGIAAGPAPVEEEVKENVSTVIIAHREPYPGLWPSKHHQALALPGTVRERLLVRSALAHHLAQHGELRGDA